MTVYQTPLVIGIFQNEIQARHAVDAIRSAGFQYDQVGVAISSSSNATPDLQVDLINLGVPQEQANFYDTAYRSGNVVVSIRPDGREDEVKNILSGNGASNYEHRPPTDPSIDQSQANHAEPPATDTETYRDEATHSIEAAQKSANDML